MNIQAISTCPTTETFHSVLLGTVPSYYGLGYGYQTYEWDFGFAAEYMSKEELGPFLLFIQWVLKYHPNSYPLVLKVEKESYDYFEEQIKSAVEGLPQLDSDSEGEWELSMKPYQHSEKTLRKIKLGVTHRPQFYQEEEYIVRVGVFFSDPFIITGGRGRASTYRKAKKLAYREMKMMRRTAKFGLPF